MESITQRKMNETWAFCVDRFGLDKCVALTLHGSQNYGLSTSESDVDAKLMVVPSWDDVINLRAPLSETIKGPYGDVNVTDIRLFIGNNLKKQNFNFIECLFTQYKCVNDRYVDLWNDLVDAREIIAHYDPKQALRTMMGQVENQWKRWNRFDNNKTLYHMMRITWAIVAYSHGQEFERTLRPTGYTAETIMDVRLGELSYADMEKIFKSKYELAHNIYDNFNPTVEKDTNAEIIMDELQKQFIYRALYEYGIEE